MLSSRIMLTLVTPLLVAAMASALPITFDGDINALDSYVAIIVDPNEAGIDDNLDIRGVLFDIDATWFYMGIALHEGPIAIVGDPTSFLGMTISFTEFTPGGLLVFTLNAGGVVSVDLNGVILAQGIDYDLLIGGPGSDGGVELRIKKDVFGPLNFDVVGQLDGTGFDNDDQFAGFVEVPEPMTMAIIAFGMPLILARRRRR